MNYVSNKEQVLIYLGKFKRNFLNANGWYAFASTAIIALITCIVSGSAGFGDRIAKTSFIIVCACIWIGMFNSITLICRERDIIKHEYRGGDELIILYVCSYAIPRNHLLNSNRHFFKHLVFILW